MRSHAQGHMNGLFRKPRPQSVTGAGALLFLGACTLTRTAPTGRLRQRQLPRNPPAPSRRRNTLPDSLGHDPGRLEQITAPVKKITWFVDVDGFRTPWTWRPVASCGVLWTAGLRTFGVAGLPTRLGKHPDARRVWLGFPHAHRDGGSAFAASQDGGGKGSCDLAPEFGAVSQRAGSDLVAEGVEFCAGGAAVA